MAKKKVVKKKKRKKRAHPWLAWVVVGIGGALSLILLLEGILRAGGGSLLGGAAEDRMARFPKVEPRVRTDLLYLSYIDSLARDDRALPGRRDGNLLRTVVAQAGIPRRLAEEWGLYPPPEAGHGELNRIFREMFRRGRIELPMENASLWDHIRERKVHPGYILFGRTAWARDDQIDFCAIATAVNWLQPEYTAVLYRDPRKGNLVHGKVKKMPTITYFGSGRLGNDLGGIYLKYFRLSDPRNEKPLFKDMH